MNDFFELRRFGFLLRKTIFERPVQLVGIAGLSLAATFVIYAGALYFMGSLPAQNLSFVYGFAGGGSFLASVVFSYFTTNASGSAYLTLPASAFEKWLCGILIVGVFYTSIFLVFYRLMDVSFITAYHNGLDKNSPDYKYLYDARHIYTFDNNLVEQSVLIFLNFAGALMVGSLYFNKVSAVKTAILYLAFVGLIFLLNLAVAHMLFNDVDWATPFNNVFIVVGDTTGSVDLPKGGSQFAHIAFMYIIPGILWLTAYIRLREKEI